ncbi:MAG: hypothetical protein DHS20C05_14230 [Hyphococcus sp.]|nr:MAG: hypothetical protein DHS20C05_14230 [Marinicaulis sp.]
MGNPVVRFEIGCMDSASTAEFYEKVFDWKTEKTLTGAEVDTGAGVGISGAITALGHEPHQYVKFYMEVPNADKAVENIKAHGGKITIGPVDIPGGKGRFAWFEDPEGNALAIFQPPE